MGYPIIVRSRETLRVTQVTRAFSPNTTPRTNYATKPYLFAVHWAHPNYIFSRIITYRHIILNYPLFTNLGNEVERTKLYAITTGLTVINIYL